MYIKKQQIWAITGIELLFHPSGSDFLNTLVHTHIRWVLVPPGLSSGYFGVRTDTPVTRTMHHPMETKNTHFFVRQEERSSGVLLPEDALTAQDLHRFTPLMRG